MDSDRFDALTREFVTHFGSRRRIVRAIAAGMATISFGALGSRQGRAKRKKRKHKHKCKGKSCEGLGLQCGNQVPDNCKKPIDCGNCPNAGSCDLATGKCGTPPCVPETCAALGIQCGNEIPDNCGDPLDCGNCPAGDFCELSTGQCGPPCNPPCPADLTCCGGECVFGCCGGSCQPGQAFADLPRCSVGAPSSCRCLNAVQTGDRLCAADIPCSELSDCTSDADCDSDVSACAVGCCGMPKCHRFCGT